MFFFCSRAFTVAIDATITGLERMFRKTARRGTFDDAASPHQVRAARAGA